jgi:hypothetical protein
MNIHYKQVPYSAKRWEKLEDFSMINIFPVMAGKKQFWIFLVKTM